jgi:xylulokinase
VSDVVGIPQLLPRHNLGACYGDALLAAMAAGLADRSTVWNEVESVVEPDPANRSVYDRLYRVYRELYPAARAQMHTLADLQLSPAPGRPGTPAG